MDKLCRSGLGGALAALVGAATFWGFTVDDALISARVASNLHHGLGYRFNPSGPLVDAVTPLGWAHLLAPFAASVQSGLVTARWLSVVAVGLAGAVLGRELALLGKNPWRWTPLLVLALCAPLGAWAVAGMETGVIILLCTLGLREGWGAKAALFLAVFARPELLPWAWTLQVGQALRKGPLKRELLLGAMLPWLAIGLAASLRAWFFGQPGPLSLSAKPADWAHGVAYAWGALIWSGPPWLLAAWWSWRRIPARLRVMALAAALHLLAMALIGGDWMPFFRLVTPVLPSLLLVASGIAEQSRAWANGLRLLLALAVCSYVLLTRSAAARGVWSQRSELIDTLAPLVTATDRVMTLDVGWVGAATPGVVIDLAGVTNPAVARLAGGHTSKRLDAGFFERFDPTLLVLLTASEATAEPWHRTRFDRVVEQRVAMQARGSGRNAHTVAQLPLRGTAKRYLVVRLTSVR